MKENTTVSALAPTVQQRDNLTSLGAKRKDEDDTFTESVVQSVLETVRKKGGVWKLYDDKTGVELGSYKNRHAAWAAQRVRRQQDHLRAQQKQSEKQYKKNVTRAQKKHKHEGLEFFIARALMEQAPYVFEQVPGSQESQAWESLISNMSHEIVQSDPKLKRILVNLQKVREKTLVQAYKTIASVLDKTGEFGVGKSRFEKSETDDLVLSFEIALDEADKKVKINITLQHDKPVFSIPDETKNLLNAMATKESKLLRAELMHVQETMFDHMHDVHNAAQKRNDYLKQMESKLDKMVTGMVPLQIALLRNLLRQKYRGMK